MATNRLRLLAERGQSVWQDNITRGQLRTGGLTKLAEEDALTGVTTNPAIFQKAIGGSADYDDVIVQMAREGKDVPSIIDTLIIQDVQQAADQLRSVYDRANGTDGFVSIEVGAQLARDTQGTIAEAHRLWKAVNRPNTMVKIPGTAEGVPAIKQCLADGLNINVTLLFSIDRYEAVARAFIEALEEHAARGQSVDRVASVASFFVSRVDTIVDQALDRRLKANPDGATQAKLTALVGTSAVANAKLAYARFEDIFGSTNGRFQKLAPKGAQVQRPLWASTSMKNPKRRDVLYVEELIAPQTVNTMPPATLDAFRDHGEARGDTAREKVNEARKLIGSLTEVGIDLGELTQRLEIDGIKLFADAYDTLVAEAEAKVKSLQASASGAR